VGTVTITVTAVNDAPVAGNDTANTNPGSAVTINVLANDNDVEGASLTPSVVTGPAFGTVTVNADKTLTYTPNANYRGTDSFTYKVNDGSLDSNTATVTISDNIKPFASDVQAANGSGGTISRLDQGDTIVYTFSEPVDPQSIIAGWDGSTRNVVVRVYDGDILLGLLTNTSDTLQVFDATNYSGSSQPLSLGTINLGRTDYVVGLLGGNIRFGDFGGSDVASTMTVSGNTVTVVLGTYHSTILLDPSRATAGGTSTLVWTPGGTALKDLAGNTLATPIATATELGPTDRDF
jgi:hypothetical protein